MDTPRELTPLRKLPRQLEAACYNRIRLALLRSGEPLRITLAQHRGLEVIIAHDAWLCVDSLMEDMPVLAWRAFQRHARDNLHQPIRCEIHLYHHCAGLIMGTAFDDLCTVAQRRFAHNRTIGEP